MLQEVSEQKGFVVFLAVAQLVFFSLQNEEKWSREERKKIESLDHVKESLGSRMRLMQKHVLKQTNKQKMII